MLYVICIPFALIAVPFSCLVLNENTVISMTYFALSISQSTVSYAESQKVPSLNLFNQYFFYIKGFLQLYV